MAIIFVDKEHTFAYTKEKNTCFFFRKRREAKSDVVYR